MKRWAVLAIALGACEGGIVGTDIDAAPGAGSTDAPTSPMPDAAIPGGVGEPAALMGMTLYHNQVRAMVQTATPLPPLEWDASLAATAAAWVATCTDTMAPIGLVDHNPNRSQGHPFYVGENIYASSGSATAQAAVTSWAGEKANFTYPNTCNGTCGHYTQIVWRTTLKVGCAIGTCNGLMYPSTIVCDYGPGGNSGGGAPY